MQEEIYPSTVYFYTSHLRKKNNIYFFFQNHLVAKNELAQSPSTLTPSNAIALSRVSTGSQVPGISICPYQDAQDRTQRYMRSEIIEIVKDTAMKYVHFESGTSLQKLMGDVVNSKSWHQVFGNSVVKDKNSDDTHFLDILSEEYKACKDKQVTKKINQNPKKQKEKFLIGNTKSQSRLPLEGKILDNVKSRTDAARIIGRVRNYGDEKRRLLSIVEKDFPYRTLQQLFGCSPNTVTPARVHCLLDVGEFLPLNLNSLDSVSALRALRNSLNIFIETTLPELLHVEV